MTVKSYITNEERILISWNKLNKEPLINPIINGFSSNTYGTPTIQSISSENHKNIVCMGWSTSNNKYCRLLFLKNIDFFNYKDSRWFNITYAFTYSKKEFDSMIDCFLTAITSNRNLNHIDYIKKYPKNQDTHNNIYNFFNNKIV